MRKRKIGTIVLFIVGITVLHYSTATLKAPLHIFYRELYFIPIVLSGLWFGKKVGVSVSLAVSLLYLPHIFELAETSVQTAHHMQASSLDTMWGNLFQVLIFHLAGFLSGSYSDIKRGYFFHTNQPLQPAKFTKSFLLYVDDTPISLYAVNYFVDIFGPVPNVRVTLLWIFQGKGKDYFNTEEEARKYREFTQERGSNMLSNTKQILLEGGIAEENIQLKTLAAQKKSRISDRLIEEVSTGNYDTIVIGKHNLTKSQEFLFGSVAIRLIREAGVHVLAVKMPEGSGDKEDHT